MQGHLKSLKIVRQYKRPTQYLNTTFAPSSSSTHSENNQNLLLSNISAVTSSTSGNITDKNNNSKQSLKQSQKRKQKSLSTIDPTINTYSLKKSKEKSSSSIIENNT